MKLPVRIEGSEVVFWVGFLSVVVLATVLFFIVRLDRVRADDVLPEEPIFNSAEAPLNLANGTSTEDIDTVKKLSDKQDEREFRHEIFERVVIAELKNLSAKINEICGR